MRGEFNGSSQHCIPTQGNGVRYETKFTIINSLGNTAIFASMTGDLAPAEQRKVAFRSASAIAAVLLVVLWVGHYVRFLLSKKGESPAMY